MLVVIKWICAIMLWLIAFTYECFMFTEGETEMRKGVKVVAHIIVGLFVLSGILLVC